MLARGTPKTAFFFEKFYRGHDPPHPRRSLYTPPVETPSPQRTWTACTAQTAGQAMPDIPGRASTRADRRPDTEHAAPAALDTRQAVPGRSYRRRRWTACTVCPENYNITARPQHKIPCCGLALCKTILNALRAALGILSGNRFIISGYRSVCGRSGTPFSQRGFHIE